MTFQIGASLLDACVLAEANRGDTYAYQLTQNLKAVFDISPSTLYPVFRRLQADHCLVSYDEQFEGRNRRYYKITDIGKAKLKFYQEEWKTYQGNVSQILRGGGDQ
jgi:PadR family transcriptional regulator PadR